MRRSAFETSNQNYDSFLDIVANLVGILVILIMVIGVRARNVVETSPDDSNATADSVAQSAPAEFQPPAEISLVPIQQLQIPGLATESLAKLYMAVTEKKKQSQAINASSHEMNANILKMKQMSDRQQAERHQLQLAISMAEKALIARRSKLGQNEQKKLRLAKYTQEAEHELGELQNQLNAVATVTATAPPKIIEHKSNPIAKTVFGEEEHFRVTGGQVAYVPMSEIVALMQRDAKTKMWKLEDSNTVTETIGPINGFLGRYTMEKRRGVVRTSDGPRMASTVELREIDMVPQGDMLGEPVKTAMTANSEFMQRINYLNPEETTITLWVYPDGYADYRELKAMLASRGFRTAARVLKFGYLIGGAPNGTKSAAE